MSASVAEYTVNAGETNQQGKSECTTSTLCLSSNAGHQMPVAGLVLLIPLVAEKITALYSLAAVFYVGYVLPIWFDSMRCSLFSISFKNL